jgi:hypothetical protein
MWHALAGTIFRQSAEWFWVMCQFVAVALSLIWIASQVRHMRLANTLQAMGVLEERWKSSLMLECRAIAAGRNGNPHLDIERPEGEVLSFFETLGLYLKRRVFDRELLWEKYSYFIEPYWQMFSPHINHLRSSRNDPSFYDQFEYLNEQMKKCARKRKLTNYSAKTPKDIQDFANGERARLDSSRKIDRVVPPNCGADL